jgi:tetratricopeptide (TPR) repeat protein
LEDVNEAIRLDPTSIKYLRHRAQIQKIRTNYELALADLNAAIQIEPSDGSLFKERADLQSLKGDSDKAISDLNQAIQLTQKPSDLSNRYQERGDVWFKKKEYDLAIADFTKATELNPKSWLAMGRRATALVRKGDRAQAIAMLDDYVRSEPTANSLYQRGAIYESLGDSDKARQDYDESIKKDPKMWVAYYSRGNLS